MEPCNILQLAEIMEILEEFHKEESMQMLVHSSLRGGPPYSKWFLHKDTCMVYEPMGDGRWNAHIYSVSRDTRGKELRDFAIKTGRWMIDNTECVAILNFVKEDRRDIRFFMASIGSRKVGKIPGTNEMLYVSTGDMGIKEA